MTCRRLIKDSIHMHFDNIIKILSNPMHRNANGMEKNVNRHLKPAWNYKSYFLLLLLGRD